MKSEKMKSEKAISGNFSPCYPGNNKSLGTTTCPVTAEGWKKEGKKITHTPCSGGVDDHEHSVYCGCAGFGTWTVTPHPCPNHWTEVVDDRCVFCGYGY